MRFEDWWERLSEDIFHAAKDDVSGIGTANRDLYSLFQECWEISKDIEAVWVAEHCTAAELVRRAKISKEILDTKKIRLDP